MLVFNTLVHSLSQSSEPGTAKPSKIDSQAIKHKDSSTTDLALRDRKNIATGTEAKIGAATKVLQRDIAIDDVKISPPMEIRVQSDLDAEWRWRFLRPSVSPSKKKGQGGV